MAGFLLIARLCADVHAYVDAHRKKPGAT